MVLLASAIGIAGWMIAPKEQPRPDPSMVEAQLEDPEKEAERLHQVIKELPGALAEASEWFLKQSQNAQGAEFTVRTYKKTEKLTVSMPDSPRIIGERALELLTERLHAGAGGLDRTLGTFAKSLIQQFEYDVFGNSFQTFAVPSATVPIASIALLSLRYPVSTSSGRYPTTSFPEVKQFGPFSRVVFFGCAWADHNSLNFAADLALLNAEEAIHSAPSDPGVVAASYEAAATLTALRANYLFPSVSPSRRLASDLVLNRALAHLRAAESQTDWQRSPEDWARIKTKIAHYLTALGHRREAEEILREVVAENEQRLGLDHPVAAASRAQLATALENVSVDSDNIGIFEGALSAISSEMSHGSISCASPPSSAAHSPKITRANPLSSRSRYANSDGLFRSPLSEFTGQSADGILDILQARRRFADTLEAEAKHTEAELHYSHLREQYAELLGPKHNDTLRATRSLARCLHAQGKDAEAIKFAKLAEEGWRTTLGADHPRTLLARDLIRSIPTAPQ